MKNNNQKERFMNRFKRFALLTLLFGVAGCASDNPQYNLLQPKNDIRDRIKIVALAPVRLGDDIPNATEARQEFGELVANELGTLGFQTVAATEYEQIFNRLRDEAGGFFDPNTGKADNEKFKKVQDLCSRELATKFHADAVLYPAIHVVTVHFAQDQARWDGVEEPISENGVPGWVLTLGGTYRSGTVPALSLCVTLKDIDGTNLYSECGGIQLVEKLIGHSFRKINDQNMLTNSARNTNAVAIVFKLLHDEPPAKSN
jgi:hypothetical protein